MKKQLAYDLESADAKLKSAAIVGAMTPTTCRLWIRAYHPGRWWLVVTSEPIEDEWDTIGNEPVAEYLQRIGVDPAFLGSEVFGNDTDRSRVFDVDGLEEGRCYHYTLYADESLYPVPVSRRREIGFRSQCCFRTPTADSPSVTFGLYSCHDPFKSKAANVGLWSDMLETLDEVDADFCIGAGDQVYVDTTQEDLWVWLKTHKRELIERHVNGDGSVDELGVLGEMVALYRYFYRKYWAFKEVREVFSRFPQYMIWDDHEIMDGWGSLTKKERSQKLDRLLEWEDVEFNSYLADLMYQAAKQVYIEYQHSHNPVTPHDQFDYGFDHGAFAFYTLDMRGDHDVERESPRNRKLLGPEQHGRFRDWMEGDAVADARALFVVSPVPVVHWSSFAVNKLDLGSVKDDFQDEWDHKTNQKERDVILKQIFRYSHDTLRPVVFLSGDVHCGGVFRIHSSEHPLANVWQVTSSPISRPAAPEIAKWIVREEGCLGGSKVFTFKREVFWAANNFGILKARAVGEAGVELIADLYGDPSSEDRSLTRRRVRLS
ncbi:MAG: alkaline phosphatase D family protein [Planctomycetota bacterium]|nr:alkaline phosphatase D family protein [Planctomycetota bacterium]